MPDDLTGNDRRYIPTFDGETDGGSAMQVVPERVGAAVAELLASGCQAWDGSAAAARRATGAKSAAFAATAPARGAGASPAPAGSSADIDAVWRRISAAAGETFHLKRGKPFTYSVYGNTIDLHTTNRRIPKSDIRRTLTHVPLTSTTVVSDLGVQAPSYVYAILMDPRVRGDAW